MPAPAKQHRAWQQHGVGGPVGGAGAKHPPRQASSVRNRVVSASHLPNTMLLQQGGRRRGSQLGACCCPGA